MGHFTSVPRRSELFVSSVPLGQPDVVVTEPTRADILAILKVRRARGNFFETSLFADPAWDMLLELYAAELGGVKISVSNLCIGSNVPATTALRWISELRHHGYIDRLNDPTDNRRVFVALTERGLLSIRAYFASIKDAHLPI